MKVIIIGAGIGGLTTGIALEQAGYEVEIFEREPELRAVGAGLTLWANAIYALDTIGLGEALRQHSIMSGEGGIHDQRAKNIMVTNTHIIQQQLGVPSVVIHRADLQDLLLNHFEGTIHYTKQLRNYDQENDKVYAQFEDGSKVEGDLLIGCDGIHSVVRQQMYPTSKPIYAGYTAFRGVLEFDHTCVGAMWGESWGCGNRFGITPLQNNRIYWFATANQPAGNILLPEERQSTLLRLFGEWHHPIPELLRETPQDNILQHDLYAIKPLKSWCNGRVVLLGDAAHAMTPNMGQGACQAIEDAIMLGKSLKLTPDVNQALAQYQARRLPRANNVLKQSEMIGKMGQIENPTLCQLRNTVLRWMPHSIRMKTLIDVISYRI